MKKNYIIPKVRVLRLNAENTILAASEGSTPGGDVTPIQPSPISATLGNDAVNFAY